MNLFKLQQQFFNAIFSKEMPEDFLAQIKAVANRSPKRALEIYRSSIRANYHACLKKIYPVCFALVGEEFFNALASRYIDEYPSYSENLNDYGEQFSWFIEHFPYVQNLPYLADVAQLEWLCHKVINAEDSPHLENEQWQSLLMDENLENIVFSLPQALALIESDYPIQKIWHDHQPGVTTSEQINLNSGAEKLVVARNKFAIEITKVSESMWLLLKLIKEQKTFGEICIAFSELNFDVVSLLPEAVKQQWVIGFNRRG